MTLPRASADLVFPEEWVLADEMIFWSPTLGKGVDIPYAKELSAAGLSLSQAATLELQWWWSKLQYHATRAAS